MEDLKVMNKDIDGRLDGQQTDAERQESTRAFMARLFNMSWLAPRRVGKHHVPKVRNEKWFIKRQRQRKVAALSRARNRR